MPQEVRRLLEVGTTVVNFVNQILDTDDVVFSLQRELTIFRGAYFAHHCKNNCDIKWMDGGNYRGVLQ